MATSTTPTGTQTYTTDLTDELISLELEDGSTVGYTHDAAGNRTSRTVDGLLDATWAWDDLSSLPMRIGEYAPAGTLSTAWLADPTSSTGASLAQTSDGVSSWLLSDPFANTVATVSTTGNTVSGTRTMDAFGVQRTTATGSLADASVGFAGQYLDGATGLYDMRARDYDPTSGRFTATDPIAVPTGMPYVAGYSYSFNNPLMFSDPSGRWAKNGVKNGWEDATAAWVAGFGDLVTFGGTEQIRRLTNYNQGNGDTDMIDHCSIFYRWGSFGLRGGDEPSTTSYFDNPATDYFSEDQLSAMSTLSPAAQTKYARMWAALSAIKFEYLTKYPDKSGHIEAAINAAALNYIQDNIQESNYIDVWRFHYIEWSTAYTAAVRQAPMLGVNWASTAYLTTMKEVWYSRTTAGAIVKGAWTASDLRNGVGLGNILSDGYDLGTVDDFQFDFTYEE